MPEQQDLGQLLALSVLTAAEAAHAFSATCPSHFTIRTFALEGDPNAVVVKIGNLRSGYLPAIGFGLALGLAVSALSRSALPLLFTVGTQVLMVGVYESALPSDLRLFARPALPSGAPCHEVERWQWEHCWWPPDTWRVC